MLCSLRRSADQSCPAFVLESEALTRLASISRYGRAPKGSTINRELACLKCAFALATQCNPPLSAKKFSTFGCSASDEKRQFDDLLREMIWEFVVTGIVTPGNVLIIPKPGCHSFRI